MTSPKPTRPRYGAPWKRWRTECLGDLVKHQLRDGCQVGSWQMPSWHYFTPGGGGTVYCTAMAILALESFYRYQPYLARFDARARPEGEGKK